jgi:hypothetical protein
MSLSGLLFICSDTFSSALDYKSNEGEHPVEFFQVYQEYLSRFEQRIANFIVEVRI